jgi:hypothetical protein
VKKSEWIVDLRRGDAFEWSALLLTVLAFPEEEPPEALMKSCFCSLCASAIAEDVFRHPERVNVKGMKPAYGFCDKHRIDRDLRQLEKRVADRMLAAKMVKPFIPEASTGESPVRRLGMKRLSLAQMAEVVLSESRESELKNLLSRIWRPSRPVIHLAAATRSALEAQNPCDKTLLTVHRILSDSAVLDLILRNAEEMVPLLANSRARVDVESLIRLRAA